MPEYQKVLVTGITGYLGAHTAIQLLNRGYSVVGTLRTPHRMEEIRAVIRQHSPYTDRLSLQLATLEDSTCWAPIIKQVEAILHLASPVPLSMPKDPQQVIRPAVLGVKNILTTATRLGIRRVILTSSIAAACYGAERRKTFTEEDWSVPENTKDHTPYTRSKTLAERFAWDYVEEQDPMLELTTILPGLVIGPILEKDYGSSANLVKRLLDGSTPFLPTLGLPMVDVRSVAELHIAALENRESIKHRIFATDRFAWIHEVAQVLRLAYPEYRVPRYRVPNFAVRLMARIDRDLEHTKIEIGAERRVNDQKARSLLQWMPIPLERSILDTAASMIRLQVV